MFLEDRIKIEFRKLGYAIIVNRNNCKSYVICMLYIYIYVTLAVLVTHKINLQKKDSSNNPDASSILKLTSEQST